MKKRKSAYERVSPRIEKFLSGKDRPQTANEIAESLGVITSSIYSVLQLMEVFNVVQKVKIGGRYRYFLKGVYSDDQISAMQFKPETRRRRSIIRSSSSRQASAHVSFLEEHLSTMRVQASPGEGPSALAMIGLTQLEMIEEEVLSEELPRKLEVALEVEERRVETPKNIEPFATVEHLPKDARKLNRLQTKHLKEQLKGLDGYEGIESFTTAFAEFSALKNGSYGTIFYFSMGTNPWENVYRVTVDDNLPLEMEEPVKRLRGRGRRSIYDPIIDRFLESGHGLVEIGVEGRNPYHVAFHLRRRIKDRELKIAASSTGDFVYLERARAIGG